MYTCLFTVHIDCYGGEPQHIRLRQLDAILDQVSSGEEADSSASDEEFEPLESYIAAKESKAEAED